MNDLLLLLILGALSLGLAARNAYLFLLAFVLLFAAGSARLWERFGLAGMEFRRHFSAREALPGDVITMRVSVSNRKLLPLSWLEWTDDIDVALQVGRATEPTHRSDIRQIVNLVALRPYERVTRRFDVRCLARGYHAIGPTLLRSGDLLGLAWSERALPARDHVLVHPPARPLQAFGMPPTDPFGDLRLKSPLFRDPTRIAATREARPGEPLRHMHWKASARHGGLYIKVLESSAMVGLSFFLDLRTGTTLWEGVDVPQQEFLIEAVAALAAEGLRRGRKVSLCANGISHLEARGDCLLVEAGNGIGYLRHLTRALALLRRYPTMSFASLLLREAPRTPWRSTLCLCTRAVDDDLRTALPTLMAHGRPLVLFVPIDAPLRDLPSGVQLRRLRSTLDAA